MIRFLKSVWRKITGRKNTRSETERAARREQRRQERMKKQGGG